MIIVSVLMIVAPAVAFLPTPSLQIRPFSGNWHVASLDTTVDDDTTTRISVAELYNNVAENDPEWFDEFVRGVLGSDAVEQELAFLDKTPFPRVDEEGEIASANTRPMLDLEETIGNVASAMEDPVSSANEESCAKLKDVEVNLYKGNDKISTKLHKQVIYYIIHFKIS